jgi:hypothetical protein
MALLFLLTGAADMFCTSSSRGIRSSGTICIHFRCEFSCSKDVIQQYLNLGVVEGLEIALAPALFGGGRRLFENIRESGPQFRMTAVLLVQPPRICATCVSEWRPNAPVSAVASD